MCQLNYKQWWCIEQVVHNICLYFVDDSLPTIITLPLHSPKPVIMLPG